MKRSVFFREFLIVALFACVFMCPFEANAGFLSSITGKLFTTILEQIGFGTDKNGYCWFCPLFQAVFNSANSIASYVAYKMSTYTLATLGVGVLFFIGFRVAATLIKLQEVDLMQFLGDLFKHLGRAMIAAAFIAAGMPIFYYLVTPLLGYSLGLAIELMSNSNFGQAADGGTNNVVHFATKYLGLSEMTSGASSICAGAPAALAGVTEESMRNSNLVLAPGLYTAMECMLATVSANLVLGMVVGLCVVGVGLFSSVIFPNVQQCASGFLIFGAFFAIYLTVPFRLMDNLIRLCFVAALMPFWVILWVFPATVQYTKNAWNMFLATCVSFISFGVVLALIMTLLNYMIPDLDGVLSALIPGYEFFASSKASVFTTNTLLTFGLGIFCKQLLGVPDEFAARIAQSYGIGIGDKVEAGIASSAATSLGMLGGIAGIAGATAAYGGQGVKAAMQGASDTQKGFLQGLTKGKTVADFLFDDSEDDKDKKKGSQQAQGTTPKPSTKP